MSEIDFGNRNIFTIHLEKINLKLMINNNTRMYFWKCDTICFSAFGKLYANKTQKILLVS